MLKFQVKLRGQKKKVGVSDFKIAPNGSVLVVSSGLKPQMFN